MEGNMPRTFWKGVISFGLVAIPVRMSIAIESKTPEFHYLHKKCLTRPKQVLFCEEDNEYFKVSETVRGYEYSKGQYVVFKEDDFDKVPVKTTHSIDIVGFSNVNEIDLIYYGGTHYLEPEKLGEKPFALLKTVLEKTKLTGIAKVAFQRREHLCCLCPMGNIIALHILHYKEDILPAEDMAAPEQKLSKNELDMATKLVETMTTGFKPDEYRDEYSLALMQMVDAKLKGVEIKVPEIPKAEIEDLMAALKASVVAAGKR
jgi:DNA end-binding protein Ku